MTRALRHVAGNLTGATSSRGDQILAWYILRPVKWSYLSHAELRAALHEQALAAAGLAGRQIHVRVSSAEYPVESWAAALDADTPDPPNPHAWFDYIQQTQTVLNDNPMTEPVVYWGVEVGKQKTLDRVRAIRADKATVAARAAVKLEAELAHINSVLATVADPADQLALEWLTHRSEGLCLPAPTPGPGAGTQPLDPTDLAGVFDSVEVDPGARPFSRSLRVVGVPGRNGTGEVDRHVVVMSVGRMEAQDCPETMLPWLMRVMQFDGAEVSMRGEVQTGERAASRLGGLIGKLFDEQSQYADRGLHIPAHKREVLGQALRVQKVMQNAWDADAASWEGQVRIAVDGATAEEALKRADQLTQHMRKTQRIALHPLRCQEAAAREFVPGEPTATTEYTRWMPADMFAAALPHAATGIGDGRGLRVGWSGERPFTWALHAALEGNDDVEGNNSGVTPVIGVQGCGKSWLMNALASLAAFQGAVTTVVDPPGTAAAVTRWAPIAEHSAVLDMMRTEFSTYACFPEPRTADFYSHPDLAGLEPGSPALEKAAWDMSQDAEIEARHERYQLTLDCLRTSLNYEMGHSGETELLLQEAIRAHGLKASASVRGVLRELGAAAHKSGDKHALRLVSSLEHISELPRARNWMLAGPQAGRFSAARLLVESMDGVAMPASPDPESWQTGERLSVALLAIGVQAAYARLYRLPAHVRKVFVFDEAHLLTDLASFRALVAKLERQSRKLNIRAFMGSQDPRTALIATDASRALIYDAFVGQVTDEEDQIRCAKLLGMHESFARELGALRRGRNQRLFLARVNGEVGLVRPTLEEPITRDLAALLDTTPTQKTARDLALTEEGWFR